jgi:hypothetical protein
MGTPRVLFEGGPNDVRTKRLAAGLWGFATGVTIALVLIFSLVLHAVHSTHTLIRDIEVSRLEAVRRTCEEANDRHATAKKGIELLARTSGHANTPAEHRLLETFVEALDPRYDCAQRVRGLTGP